MFNLCTEFVFLLLIVFNHTRHSATAEHDECRNCTNKYCEDRSLKNLLHLNLLENNVSKLDSKIEMYNVTLTDINGKEIRIILNITLLVRPKVVAGEGISFTERAREDAFEKTSAEKNPYSVLLLLMKDDVAKAICSGSLLTQQWVLTAAHCTQTDPQLNSVVVYAGGYSMREILEKKQAEGSQVSKSTEFYVHPEFHIDSHDADISVVKAGPFELTNTVNIVRLSTEPWTYHSYKECVVTGYGVVQLNVKSDDDTVRKTHTLLVKNPCLCSFALRQLMGVKKAKRYICTKPLEDYGLCPGDSGGGLVCDGRLEAVGMLFLQMRDIDTCDITLFPPGGAQCGSKNSLTIFQDTCPFLHWINSHVELFNESEISPKCVYTGSIDIIYPSYTFLSLLFIISKIL